MIYFIRKNQNIVIYLIFIITTILQFISTFIISGLEYRDNLLAFLTIESIILTFFLGEYLQEKVIKDKSKLFKNSLKLTFYVYFSLLIMFSITYLIINGGFLFNVNALIISFLYTLLILFVNFYIYLYDLSKSMSMLLSFILVVPYNIFNANLAGYAFDYYKYLLNIELILPTLVLFIFIYIILALLIKIQLSNLRGKFE